MSHKNTPDQPISKQSDVSVVTTPGETDQYRIVATATFNCTPSKIWTLLWDWEQLLAVGLPGMTNNFQWLNGGPDEIPSSFQFEVGNAIIKEEIYERRSKDPHCLRYRTLEPALGVVEYDAVIELVPIDDEHTAFSATREVKFESGTEPDMLINMVNAETRYLQEYFAG
jgi:hypothetical protein